MECNGSLSIEQVTLEHMLFPREPFSLPSPVQIDGLNFELKNCESKQPRSRNRVEEATLGTFTPENFIRGVHV